PAAGPGARPHARAGRQRRLRRGRGGPHGQAPAGLPGEESAPTLRLTACCPPRGPFLPWGGPAAKSTPTPRLTACCPPRGPPHLGAARRWGVAPTPRLTACSRGEQGAGGLFSAAHRTLEHAGVAGVRP